MKHRGNLHRGLKIYGLAWRAALPRLKKNRRLQQGFHHRTTFAHLRPADIWIQAASAGEAYLACAVVQALVPDRARRILVTTTTTQGMDILQAGLSPSRVSPHLTVFFEFFPFDAPAFMDQAVAAINPGIMVLLETELWPGLLWALKKRRIPVAVVNGRLSRKSVSRYAKIPGLWKSLAPDVILAISGEDARRFRSIFPDTPIRTMPNIKFDALMPPDDAVDAAVSQAPPDLPFSPDIPVTLLASVRMEEEPAVNRILSDILTRHPGQVVGLFPRHMHRIPDWKALLTRSGRPWRLRSAMTAPAPAGTTILWDTFGELKAACSHAVAAFVGGSLSPLGGQNFLEPAMCGAVTVTGPHLDNFNWVGDGIFSTGAVTRARNEAGVIRLLSRALDHPPPRQNIADAARHYIRRHRGGTVMAVDTITTTLQCSEKP